MKFFIFTLAIFLTGQYSAYHQVVADRYSWFFAEPIVVAMVPKSGYANGIKNCGADPKKIIATGCTYTLKDGTPYYLELSNNPKWYSRFEHDLLHEIGHYKLRITDEKKADAYADLMIKFRNSIY